MSTQGFLILCKKKEKREGEERKEECINVVYSVSSFPLYIYNSSCNFVHSDSTDALVVPIVLPLPAGCNVLKLGLMFLQRWIRPPPTFLQQVFPIKRGRRGKRKKEKPQCSVAMICTGVCK